MKRSPIRKRNLKRWLRNWLRQYGSKTRVERIKALPCFVPGCESPSENCHTFSKRTATWRDIFNGCHAHHVESHTIGLHSFAAKYNVDPWAQAAKLAEEIPA